MISNPKKKESKEQPTLVAIHFLNIDGTLSDETYELSEDRKYFVSLEDFKKYGKVEEWSDGSKVQFLKRFRGGRPSEIVPDPWSMMAKSTDLSAYTTRRGERFCEYVKVKQEIFDTYQVYLQTRNPRYFAFVDKSMKDGDNQ